MCWIDFHNGIWGCGLLCTLLISFYFTANTPRATTPHLYITGYHAEGYHAPSIPHGPPRLYHHCTAITSAGDTSSKRLRIPPSKPEKNISRRFPYFPNNIFEEYFRQFFWTQTAQTFVENIPRKKRSYVGHRIRQHRIIDPGAQRSLSRSSPLRAATPRHASYLPCSWWSNTSASHVHSFSPLGMLGVERKMNHVTILSVLLDYMLLHSTRIIIE